MILLAIFSFAGALIILKLIQIEQILASCRWMVAEAKIIKVRSEAIIGEDEEIFWRPVIYLEYGDSKGEGCLKKGIYKPTFFKGYRSYLDERSIEDFKPDTKIKVFYCPENPGRFRLTRGLD